MKVKVNYGNLKEKSAVISADASLLYEEINKLRDILSEIESCWTSNGSKVAVLKMNAYYTNMEQIVKSLDEFSRFAKYAEDTYYNGDVKWKNDVEKVGAYFGREEIKLNN